ncbi:portal protein [Mesorhizobium sp. Z1-4]|uniref:portal protein n=1 Tax=Mesorhizobium sp. Z1-4 TaxID=2448478 RepID=UPI0013DF36DD|nr:portal protein [Mesorhizobium sp. Z1-4]
MADTSELSPVAKARQRSRQAWNSRSGWDQLYQDAYDYVLPNRRPGGQGVSKNPATYIFDMTGPNSAIYGAGQLQRQVFPLSTPFVAETGPLLAQRLSAGERAVFDRELNRVANFVYPFFQSGSFDTAVHEYCTDLMIGTGALLPLKGPSIEEPLLFCTIPQDEIAIGQDAWGRTNFVSWKRANLGREAALLAWPNGNFTKDFRDRAKDRPYEEITVYQDFRKLPDGRWEFVAYLEKDGDDFIARSVTLTQPIAVGRFYRVAGEAYGRGPVLFALPTIKTVNKAQELVLKSAAIQLLGIWGYRAGGTFNPDTIRLGPGEFWPMHSTGGVLGPDVQRLDPASGRLDVARLIVGGGQQQIRDAMLDTRIYDDGGTPPSASEVAAQLQQNTNIHVGAYGRLERETVPVVVARSMEILNGWGLLPQLMSFNELLTSIYFNSPARMAMKADQTRAAMQYYELAATIAPQSVSEYIHKGRLLEHVRQTSVVPATILPSPEEAAAAREQAQGEQLAGVAGEATVRAAPQLVQAAQAEAEAA